MTEFHFEVGREGVVVLTLVSRGVESISVSESRLRVERPGVERRSIEAQPSTEEPCSAGQRVALNTQQQNRTDPKMQANELHPPILNPTKSDRHSFEVRQYDKRPSVHRRRRGTLYPCPHPFTSHRARIAQPYKQPPRVAHASAGPTSHR